MRQLSLLILTISILWVSCSTKDEMVSLNPSLEILFSNDSVSFDTLLSDTRSHTQRLKIYNPQEESILLSSVQLGLASVSDYSIIVNGKETDHLQNELILGGDSILVLVEVHVNPRNRNLPYLVKDSIIVNWNGNSEHVKLVSWGQDIKKIESQSICTTTWTSDRPYFVEGILEIEEGCTLTIEQGTKIYFNNNSLLLVSGNMIAQGHSANHILFSSSRFDSGYDNIPGQWSGIVFLEQSTNNQLAYTTIENADIGLGIGYQIKENSLLPGDIGNGLQTQIDVRNTIIRNTSTAGLLAFNSNVSATNSLIYNCGSFLVGNFAGGDYTYQHCTITNEPSLFIHEDPTIQFSDNAIVGQELLVDNLTIEITNSILWGSQDEELLINNGGEAMISSSLTSNIIRSGLAIPNNITSQEFNFPEFKNPFSFDYSLDTLSPAKDEAMNIGILKDILDANRDAMPDIGAFERMERE